MGRTEETCMGTWVGMQREGREGRGGRKGRQLIGGKRNADFFGQVAIKMGNGGQGPMVPYSGLYVIMGFVKNSLKRYLSKLIHARRVTSQSFGERQ